MSTPLVSIISVNYNEPEETKLFLDSLYKSDYQNFETIIVDNGSKRKISKNLEKHYPKLTCIINEKNLGFAGGNNIGVDKAKGEYLIFFNNDTIIPSLTVSMLTQYMINNPNVGIASPKIIFEDNKIQYAGSTRLNTFTGRGKRIGFYEDDIGQYNNNYQTDLVHGAAMITSRKVIEEVGKMFEDYFLYYEELDWCMHIKKANYKIWYIGKAHITHKESLSVGIDSPLKTYYMSRNRILFQRRNTKGISRIISIIFYCTFGASKLSLRLIFSKKYSQLENLWRGIFWHVNKKYVFKD